MVTETYQSDSCPIIIIAHEFFDALPVHVFQYTGNYSWSEKLITNNFDTSKPNLFEWTLSEQNNQAVQKILNPEKRFANKNVYDSIQIGDTIEISKESGIIMNSMSELIAKINGAALIIDYGEDHAFTNSIRVLHLFLFGLGYQKT